MSTPAEHLQRLQARADDLKEKINNKKTNMSSLRAEHDALTWAIFELVINRGAVDSESKIV